MSRPIVCMSLANWHIRLWLQDTIHTKRVLNTGASSEKRLAYERNTGVISNGFLDGKPLVQRWGIMFDYQGIITLLLVYRYSLSHQHNLQNNRLFAASIFKTWHSHHHCSLQFPIGSTNGNTMPEPLEAWHWRKKATLGLYLKKYIVNDCKCDISINMNSGCASTWAMIYLQASGCLWFGMLHQPFDSLVNVCLILARYAVHTHLAILQCLHKRFLSCHLLSLTYRHDWVLAVPLMCSECTASCPLA